MKWRTLLTSLALGSSLVIAACSGGGTASAKGKAVYAVSDAAADMGTVTHVNVTIDSVKVHSKTGAWVDLATKAQTYDLLELKAQGVAKVLAQTDLAAGDYDQIDMHVSKCTVVDAKGTSEAKLPSNELKFNSALHVVAGGTSTGNLDFQTDKSLHVTGEGKYILAPVIRVETRANAAATVDSSNVVKITGGAVTSSDEIGEDIAGNVGAGLRISSNAVLSLNGDKVVQTKGDVVLSGTIKSVDAAAGTVTVAISDGTTVVLKGSPGVNIQIGGQSVTIASLATQVGTSAVVQFDAETKALSNVSGSASGSASGTATAGGTVSAGGSASAKVTVNGVIKAVDAAKGTVTVTSDAGTDIVLNVTSSTTIKAAGAVATMAQLATDVGSKTTIEYDTQTKAATSVSATNAVSAQASGSASASGTLKAVDVVAGTVTLLASDGTTVVLKVNSATKITADGAGDTMVGLATKLGSKLSASYDAQTMTAASLSATKA